MKIEAGIHPAIPHCVTVSEFVHDKSCLWITPQTTLYDIVTSMREKHSYAAMVMDGRKLIGLLTEHETLLYIISWLSAPSQNIERVSQAFNVLKAADVMIRYPKTLEGDMPLDQAFDKMSENGFRYMPVLENNYPVGILNRSDIMRYLQEQNRKELESKDMMLSYLMHHENYGCL